MCDFLKVDLCFVTSVKELFWSHNFLCDFFLNWFSICNSFWILSSLCDANSKSVFVLKVDSSYATWFWSCSSFCDVILKSFLIMRRKFEVIPHYVCDVNLKSFLITYATSFWSHSSWYDVCSKIFPCCVTLCKKLILAVWR